MLIISIFKFESGDLINLFCLQLEAKLSEFKFSRLKSVNMQIKSHPTYYVVYVFSELNATLSLKIKFAKTHYGS